MVAWVRVSAIGCFRCGLSVKLSVRFYGRRIYTLATKIPAMEIILPERQDPKGHDPWFPAQFKLHTT
jgi:hypothetical protein